MDKIYTYTLTEPLKTTNGGNCRWGLAQKGQKKYFIKELLSPVYPMDDCGLSEAVIKRKRQGCRKFEQRQTEIYTLLNQNSNGALHRIEEFFRHGSRYYVVTEQIESLPDGMIADLRFSQEERERVCYVLLHALAGMHKAGLIHGDIKLDNVLFYRTSQGCVSAKIIDFEDAFRTEESPEPGEEIRGDQIYLSPEAFRLMTGESLALTQAIDVYALGLVLYQILSGRKQIMGGQEYTYPFEALINGKELVLNWDGIPQKFRDCIRKMLRAVPEERPSLSSVLRELRGESTEETAEEKEPEKEERPEPLPNAHDPEKTDTAVPADPPGERRGSARVVNIEGQKLYISMGKGPGGKAKEGASLEKAGNL